MKLFPLVSILAISIGCGGIHLPQPQPPIPPAPSQVFDTVACASPAVNNHCQNPIQGAQVKVHLSLNPDTYDIQTSNSDGYNLWTVPASLILSDITFTADGYIPATFSVTVNDLTKQHNIFWLLPIVPPLPQPQQRAPLQLEGNDGSLICHHDQIVTIPTGVDINFWRGDAWGVTLPGLPFVPGGSSKHPERALTWFLDRYPSNWQTKILQQYRRDGYTHFVLSWPDSRDGNGQSVSQYVQTSLKVKQAGLYVAHFLTSKDFDPKDADGATRMAAVTPVIDALVAARAVDILVVGWELNTFNEPHRLQDFIDALTSRYPGIPLYAHFSTYVTSWQFPGEPRAEFWTRNKGKLTGLLYQGNQDDSCGLMQAHYSDACTVASGIAAVGAKVIPFELLAANEFDNDHPNEEDANARGWEVMNTPACSGLTSGFGNGGRFPNGKPTLTSYPK